MLGDPKGELKIAPFRFARRAFGRYAQIHVVNDDIVAALHQNAARHRPIGKGRRRGSGRPPVRRRRKFFLVATISIAASSASGAMMTSVKIFTISAAASASNLRLSAMMPPNADTGSQRSASS